MLINRLFLLCFFAKANRACRFEAHILAALHCGTDTLNPRTGRAAPV
jgi:hypothetical protein